MRWANCTTALNMTLDMAFFLHIVCDSLQGLVFLTDGRFKMDDFDIGGCFETGDLDLEDCGSASVKLTHVTQPRLWKNGRRGQ